MLTFTRGMLIYGSNFIEKGHPRKIPVKLFQNLTSGFREKDFLKTFSEFLHVRLVQETPFTRAMFMDGSKFRTNWISLV